MSVLDNSIRVAVGILLVTLFEMAWSDVNTPERLRMAQTLTLSSQNQISSIQDSDAAAYVAGNSTATNLSAESSSQRAFGDGRTGFWIVGILVNISMLGIVVIWAVKEWRKKKG